MDAASYFLNFDIDEYLINNTNIPLPKYLEKQIRNNTFSVYSFLVPIFSHTNDPNCLNDKHPSTWTKDDFKFREKQYLKKWPKIIYPPRKALLVLVHSFLHAESRLANYMAFCKLNKDNRRLSSIQKPIWYQTLSILCQFLLIKTAYYIRKIMIIIRRKIIRKPDFYCFHYYGLNSNWQLKEALTGEYPMLQTYTPSSNAKCLRGKTTSTGI